jgi:hypothetical protein
VFEFALLAETQISLTASQEARQLAMRAGLEKKCPLEQRHTACASVDVLDAVSKNLRNFVAASKISEKYALPNAHRAWRVFASDGVQRVKAETTAKGIAASPREKNSLKKTIKFVQRDFDPGNAQTAQHSDIAACHRRQADRRLHVKIPDLGAAV